MKQIGLILKEKREEKRLTVETVHLKTYIPSKFIRAIEDGDPSAFPAEVYLIGSMKRYAEFLGLNGADLVAQYRGEKQQPQAGQAPAVTPVAPRPAPRLEPRPGARPEARPAAHPEVRAQAERPVALEERPTKEQKAERIAPASRPAVEARSAAAPSVKTKGRSTALPVIAALFVVAALLASLVFLGKRMKEAGSIVGFPATDAPATSTGTVSAQPVAAPLVLEVNASRSSSWVRVSADDKPVFDGTIPQGERKQLPANERFHLVVGSASGVDVTLNGKPIDIKRAARYDVSEVDLTKADAETPAETPKAP